MKRIALLALASGLAIAAAAPANAAVFVSVIVDGVQLNASPNTALDLGTGLYTGTFLGAGGNVMLNIDITGKGSSAFSAPDPSFLTQAVTVDATGTHTVAILLSQTGLTSPTTGFAATNTFNLLSGSLSGAATATATVGNTNVAYSSGTQIGTTLSCSTGAGTCASGVMTGIAAHPATYSETVAYNFTITNGRIQANTQIVAAPVPEPATWGMMIVGFGLMGGVLRRRSTKVAFA